MECTLLLWNFWILLYLDFLEPLTNGGQPFMQLGSLPILMT